MLPLTPPMPQLFQILKDEAARSEMQRNIRCLSILAGNLQLSDSAALMLEILDQKLTKLFTPQGVIEQDRQNSAVALALERSILREIKRTASLVIVDRRRLALIAFP